MIIIMRQFYLDTNIFIAHLKPDDPYHREAKIIANNLKKDEIQAETSVITLLETASVASRLYGSKNTAGMNNRLDLKVFMIKTLKRLAELKIKFIHISGDDHLALGDIHTDIPSIINESILLSLQTTLRTLDLIHIAAARYAKQMNHGIGAFITGDGAMLSKKEQLYRITGIPFLSPRQYIKGLGLKE